MKLLALGERQEVDETVEEEAPEQAKQRGGDPQPRSAGRAGGNLTKASPGAERVGVA